VQAARLLRAEGRELDFVLAGSLDEGNPASVPSGTVQRWVQEGSVAWIGHVDNMPALFSTTDIVVLPSYREGLPKGLIEAAACALPIVATDVPGCREVVNDGENGLLVPARDVRSLASAIARLHDDAMLRERLGESAMWKARIEFAESVVNGQTTRLYHQLLA
jgi:glycosyltransferase involved in cell wall biosynthesis